ncbi:MAG: TonB-dependent receptor plug domain-containing protein, partial [Spirochaetales bacterium]|nr:TonB-dependent receptor plug domain-containing protein [Spirochaetales bacterium]
EGSGRPSEEVFDIFAEKISVASYVETDIEKQPASVSVITRGQIRLSGARTLNEVLMIYVPGFFMVEDQDDVIAAVRGLAPDSNSKILMLLNGQNINTEWFWGPPDSILQGIDLNFIERIEVIRGPGSVTLGQGALLGVINVVTRDGRTYSGTTLTGGLGENEFSQFVLQTGQRGEVLEELQTYFYFSSTGYRGQRLRSLAWTREKDYEGAEGNFELSRGLYQEKKPTDTLGDSNLAL